MTRCRCGFVGSAAVCPAPPSRIPSVHGPRGRRRYAASPAVVSRSASARSQVRPGRSRCARGRAPSASGGALPPSRRGAAMRKRSSIFYISRLVLLLTIQLVVVVLVLLFRPLQDVAPSASGGGVTVLLRRVTFVVARIRRIGKIYIFYFFYLSFLVRLLTLQLVVVVVLLFCYLRMPAAPSASRRPATVLSRCVIFVVTQKNGASVRMRCYGLLSPRPSTHRPARHRLIRLFCPRLTRRLPSPPLGPLQW